MEAANRSSNNMISHRGSCLCGKIRFEVKGKLPYPDACHCSQCRKHTGHFLVSCDVPRAALTLQGEEYIGWFVSSEKARRGFCKHCGSTLFWDPLDRDWIGIAMGAFDGETQSKIKMHIFVASKGDYYEIDGSAEQFRTFPPTV